MEMHHRVPTIVPPRCSGVVFLFPPMQLHYSVVEIDHFAAVCGEKIHVAEGHVSVHFVPQGSHVAAYPFVTVHVAAQVLQRLRLRCVRSPEIRQVDVLFLLERLEEFPLFGDRFSVEFVGGTGGPEHIGPLVFFVMFVIVAPDPELATHFAEQTDSCLLL